MFLKAVSVFITDTCNYSCLYCNQKKQESDLEVLNVSKIAQSVFCNICTDGYVGFYGGEPLLEIGKIRELVEYIRKRRADIRFSLTTNGSLIDDKVESFLKENFYSLMISYDGENGQDLRKKGSAQLIRKSIQRFVNSDDLEFSTNSVFTPDTVGNLFSVIEEINKLGVKNIRTSLDLTTPWSEEAIEEYKAQLLKISNSDLREKSSTFRTLRDRKLGYFQCSGCDNRISIGPDGTVTGCFIFQDFVMNNSNYPGIDNYIIGDIEDEDLLDKIEASRKYYKRLAQYQCLSESGFCMDCDLRDFCAICPITLARADGTLTSVPEWICQIKRVEFEIRERILSGEFS